MFSGVIEKQHRAVMVSQIFIQNKKVCCGYSVYGCTWLFVKETFPQLTFVYSKTTIETPQQWRQWHSSGVFIVNCEQISHFSSVAIIDFEQVNDG